MRDIEAAIVGRAITDADALYSLRMRPEHIGDPFLHEVLRTALELASHGVEVNLLTLADSSKTLSSRASELAELTTVAALGKLEYHEERIIEAYRRRELRKLGMEVSELDDESDEIFGWIETRLEEIMSLSEKDRVYSQGELLPAAIDLIEQRYKSGGALAGLPTGFPLLDEMIMGLRERMLHYIVARPSQGKSAILLQMALSASQEAPAGFISLESGNMELTIRNLASEGKINATALNTGTLGPVQFADLNKAVQRLEKRPLYFYDVPNVGIDRLCSVARMMQRRYGIKSLFVDYLQIISVKADTKRERVEVASLRLKQLARELEIPIVVGAQAKREDGARPTLESIQHSDQAGQDADVAIFLHRIGDTTWAIVEKNRDGAKGEVPLHFHAAQVRFEEKGDDMPTF